MDAKTLFRSESFRLSNRHQRRTQPQQEEFDKRTLDLLDKLLKFQSKGEITVNVDFGSRARGESRRALEARTSEAPFQPTLTQIANRAIKPTETPHPRLVACRGFATKPPNGSPEGLRKHPSIWTPYVIPPGPPRSVDRCTVHRRFRSRSRWIGRVNCARSGSLYDRDSRRIPQPIGRSPIRRPETLRSRRRRCLNLGKYTLPLLSSGRKAESSQAIAKEAS